ncbi:DedA family protein [bacterium]|nr:DedA family protein [bacterium]
MSENEAEQTDDQKKPVSKWHIHRRMYDWVLHWADTKFGTPALGVLSFTESSFFPVPPDPLLMALALAKPKRSFYYALVCSIASVLGGLFGYFIGFALWAPVGAPILRHLHLLSDDHSAVVVQVIEGTEVTIKLPDGSEDSVDRFELHVSKPGEVSQVGERDYETEQTGQEIVVGQTVYFMTDKYHQARAGYERMGVWIVLTAAFTPIPYKVFTILSGLAALSLPGFLLASALGRSARFFLVGGLIFFFGEKVRTFIERYFNILCVVFMALLIACFYWLDDMLRLVANALRLIENLL